MHTHTHTHTHTQAEKAMPALRKNSDKHVSSSSALSKDSLVAFAFRETPEAQDVTPCSGQGKGLVLGYRGGEEREREREMY